MLKMTVGISGLLKFINEKLDTLHSEDCRYTKREKEQVIELLLRHFICRGNNRRYNTESSTATKIFKQLSDDYELGNELHYYGEVVGDMVIRYFDYLGDDTGYDCTVSYNVQRRRVYIEGNAECLRRRLDKYESA